MRQGNTRRIIAAGMLAACLLLAVAHTAEARPLEPATHDQVASLEESPQKMAFWERLLHALGSARDKVSVLIDPFG